MLKKLSHIVFAGYYLILSLGLSVSAHYCLGEISSLSVLVAADPCACGADEPMPCCNTETVSISLEDEQVSAKSIQTNGLSWLLIPATQFRVQDLIKIHFAEIAQASDNGPPLISGKDIRIKIQALIFYA
jgi:hypothetical protein